jgi:cellulose synthase/poly-beta-1,6-N-acetylglucosamine synthase-like glycosyltransferase
MPRNLKKQLRLTLRYLRVRSDHLRSELNSDTRVQRLELRWSELWISLKVITVLGMFFGSLGSFIWGWIIALSLVLYPSYEYLILLDLIVYLFSMAPAALVISILLLRVPMSEYHRGIVGFFALIATIISSVNLIYLLPVLISNPFALPFPIGGS